MNKDKLREEIAEHDGCKYEIYLDHLALPTCGVGHLITESDEEYGKPVGTIVEQELVRNLFALDIAVTLDECKELINIKTRQYAKRQNTWARGHMKNWNKLYSKNFSILIKKTLKAVS